MKTAVVARWSDVPLLILAQDRGDLEAIVDGRGYVVIYRRTDPLGCILEVVE